VRQEQKRDRETAVSVPSNDEKRATRERIKTNAHQNNKPDILVGKKPMPTKNYTSAHQKNDAMPTKKETKTGWLEFSKKGTKNPKRYAYRRRWIPNGSGGWKKSKPVRIKTIQPMSEGDYVNYKTKQENARRIKAGNG